jgi:hypothetical protein
MAKKVERKVVSKKTHTFTLVTYSDGEKHLIRENDGFNSLELLGYLTHIQLDIQQQYAGLVKPDIVERKFVKQSKTK